MCKLLDHVFLALYIRAGPESDEPHVDLMQLHKYATPQVPRRKYHDSVMHIPMPRLSETTSPSSDFPRACQVRNLRDVRLYRRTCRCPVMSL